MNGTVCPITEVLFPGPVTETRDGLEILNAGEVVLNETDLRLARIMRKMRDVIKLGRP